MKIPIDHILTNPDQPRRTFDESALEALAESVRAHGLLNPIVVTRHPERVGHYLVVDGERRLRACQRAGFETIEANLVTPDDLRLRATLANTQRADLNPIEEARAIKALRDEHYTLEKICKAIGRSMAHVMNRLMLLEMDDEVQVLVAQGDLPTVPVALQAIMALPNGKRAHYAREFARRGMSVRMIVRTCERIRRNLTWEKEEPEDISAVNREKPALGGAAIGTIATPCSQNQKLSSCNPKDAIGAAARKFKPPAVERRKTQVFDLISAFRIQAPMQESWEHTCAAARFACRQCVLIDEAGPRNCRDCALVVALMRMGGQGNGR